MAKIGILVFTHKVKERGTRKDVYFDSFEYLGMRAVEREINRKKHTVDYISSREIDDYDFVLVSLTSIYDVLNLCNEVPVKRKARVIIGGQGVVNVKTYVDYFDIAVWGRAEGQINDILDGDRPKNVLEVSGDRGFEKKYEYRQAKYLVPGEKGVGCPNKCRFCFYSWTHHQFPRTENFSAAIGGQAEDDFRNLEIKDGRYYVSAIDGVSEESRKKVAKPIRNEDIVQKFKEIYSKKFSTRVSLKLFTICGFPWEKPGPEYLDELKSVFKQCDEPGSNFPIYVNLLFTPFSPEPLTPMEMERPDLKTNWRQELLKEHPLYDSKTLKVFIMPYILSPYAIFERVFFHRGGLEDKEVLAILLNPKFRKLKSWKKMAWLWKNIDIEKFINPPKKEWDYLYVPGTIEKELSELRRSSTGERDENHSSSDFPM